MAQAVPLEAVQMEMQGQPSGVLLRTIVIGLTAFLTVVDLFATQGATELDSGIATTLPPRMLQASATAAGERALRQYVQAWDHAADWLRGRPAANRPSPACHAAHTMAAGDVQCRGRRDCKGPDWSRSDRLVESGTVFPCRRL